jgi:hypothetical protein
MSPTRIQVLSEGVVASYIHALATSARPHASKEPAREEVSSPQKVAKAE